MTTRLKSVLQTLRSWFMPRKAAMIKVRTRLTLEHLEDRLAPAGVSTTELITNGSFEDGTYSPLTGTSFVNVLAGSTKITGWSVGGVAVDWHNDVEMKPINAGTKCVDLNLAGSGLSNTGTLRSYFKTLERRRTVRRRRARMAQAINV